MTTEPTMPAIVLSTTLVERFEDALGSYWDCAYQEGHLNRPDGDKANNILHEIRSLLREGLKIGMQYKEGHDALLHVVAKLEAENDNLRANYTNIQSAQSPC